MGSRPPSPPPPLPFQTPELGASVFLFPHIPPAIQAPGPDPQSPSHPWITKALRGSIRPAPPSGEAATINASLPAPHYHSISVGLSLDELPPSPLGDWRW